MIYAPEPPYEILSTKELDFATMQRLRRFAKYWEIFSNSGRFPHALRLLLGGATESPVRASPFSAFFDFSSWLHARGCKTSGIALNRQIELLGEWLAQAHSDDEVKAALVADYQRSGKRDALDWLALPKRQARHLELS
jgi:hypothetical protein